MKTGDMPTVRVLAFKGQGDKEKYLFRDKEKYFCDFNS